MKNTFTIEPKGAFSMDAVREWECGFLRGTRACSAGEGVKLAFPLDRTFAITGVHLRWDGAKIHGRIFGGAVPAIVKRQVARVLGADQDADRFQQIIAREPALERLATPTFRPVVAYSPYAMAGWSVLSQRTRMAQAAKLQIAIAEAAGDVVAIDGDTIASFPRPQSLLARDGFRGVSPEKWARLQAVARAALDGRLEVERLMGMKYEDARADLMSIRGVGAWTADAILVRGCGPTDLLPLAEPRLHEMCARVYGKPVEEVAERWRPFRTWVSVLLVSEHFELARAMIP